MAKVELLAGERCPGETSRAVIACNDYLRLGPGRSLNKLHRVYTETAPDLPPTRNRRVLGGWSAKFSWPDRAGVYDVRIEEAENERRRQAMESGLALDYERVLALKRLAEGLLARYDRERAQLSPRDAKLLLEQLRGLLADLAQETGGRQPKRDMTPQGIINYNELSDAQLERIANGEDPLRVLSHGGFPSRPG